MRLTPDQSRDASLPRCGQDKINVESAPDPVKIFCHSVLQRRRERDLPGLSPSSTTMVPHRLGLAN